MSKAKKVAYLLLVGLLAVGILLLIQPIDAQSTPKPYVPEFTLSYDTHSSDKPPTYITDPYTGEQQLSSPAKHYEWQTINVTIKNQPFTPYKIAVGNNVVDASLYYNVNFKGGFEDEWGYFDPTFYAVQDASKSHTVITFFVGGHGPNGASGVWDPRYLKGLSADRGGQVDFQVKALSGYVQPGSLGKSAASYFDVWTPGTFNGTESEWSNTQTITIPSANSSPATIPSVNSSSAPSPTVPELSWLALLPICLIMLSVALVLRRRRVNSA